MKLRYSQDIQSIFKYFFMPVLNEMELNWVDTEEEISFEDTSELIKQNLEILFRIDRVQLNTYKVISKVKIPRRCKPYLMDRVKNMPKFARPGEFVTLRVDAKHPQDLDFELSKKVFTGDSHNYLLRPEEFRNIVDSLERIDTIEYLRENPGHF